MASKIQIDLKKRDVLQHYSKTVYYTIISLFLIVAAVSICLNQLKQIITNYQAAQSLSLVSLSISLVWHFCLFWQHIIFVGIGSYYQFLRFPACGFFLQSFIFEMRLIQEVFKGHYYAELQNDRLIRRKLLTLQCSIYVCFILFFIYQNQFLYNPLIVVFSNGGLWIPQIYRTYQRNSRSH